MTDLNAIVSSNNPWLPMSGETAFRSLDGSDVAAWLAKNGYTVVKHYDTGRNGLAITACGFQVSTNGHVSKTA